MALMELRIGFSQLDWRDYLDGLPVHNGDQLEFLHDGEWICVRNEAQGPDLIFAYG